MSISRQQLDAVVEQLSAWFPQTFFVYVGKRKPLKVGIHRDLEQAVVGTTERHLLRFALACYVRELGYQKLLMVGAERIDLDGKVAGVVTEAQAERAKATIAGLKAKRQKQRGPAQPKKKVGDGLSALREAARKRQALATGGGA